MERQTTSARRWRERKRISCCMVDVVLLFFVIFVFMTARIRILLMVFMVIFRLNQYLRYGDKFALGLFFTRFLPEFAEIRHCENLVWVNSQNYVSRKQRKGLLHHSLSKTRMYNSAYWNSQTKLCDCPESIASNRNLKFNLILKFTPVEKRLFKKGHGSSKFLFAFTISLLQITSLSVVV